MRLRSGIISVAAYCLLVLSREAPSRVPVTRSGFPIQSLGGRNGFSSLPGGKLRARGYSNIGDVTFGHGVYFATVTIGDIHLNVALDTASSDLWAISSDCKSSSCASLPSYPFAFHSSTLTPVNNNNTLFNVTYTDGTSASGFVARELVTVNNVTIPSQAIALVNQTDLVFQDKVSGILGLGFTRLSTISSLISNGTSFFANLAASGNLTYPMFGLNLGGGSTGSLTFGAVDASIVNNASQISWHPVVPFASPKGSTNSSVYLHWALEVSSVTVGGVPVKLHPSFPAIDRTPVGILDVGNEGLFGPYQDVAAIFSQLDPSSRLIGDGQWAIDCATNASLSVVFGSQNITLRPEDYIIGPVSTEPTICTAWPQALPPNPEGIDWQFGTPFLRSVYSVFSFGIDNREPPMIGLFQSNASSAVVSAPASSTSSLMAFTPTTTVTTTLPNFPFSTPSFTATSYAFNTSSPFPTIGQVASTGLANSSYTPILKPLNSSAIPTIYPNLTLLTLIVTDSAGHVQTETLTSRVPTPTVTLGLPPGVSSCKKSNFSRTLFQRTIVLVFLLYWTM